MTSRSCEYTGCASTGASLGLCDPHYREVWGDVPVPVKRGRAKIERSVGERSLTSEGYVRVVTETGTAAEHRLVMEEHLGRELVRGENVHHRNGDRADNRLANLELWLVVQPAGQRVSDLIDYILEFHREELANRLETP